MPDVTQFNDEEKISSIGDPDKYLISLDFLEYETFLTMKSPMTLLEFTFLISIILSFFRCVPDKNDDSEQILLADPDATQETKALMLNLKNISEEGVLFRHQDDLAYGVFWKEEDVWKGCLYK